MMVSFFVAFGIGVYLLTGFPVLMVIGAVSSIQPAAARISPNCLDIHIWSVCRIHNRYGLLTL